MGRNVIQFKDKDNNVYDVKDVIARTTKADVIINNTESAPIASVKDAMGDMPVKTLEVEIEPMQDLHGYDSPWPAGGGKNLLKNDSSTLTNRGITFTVNDDGSVNVSGSNTDSSYARTTINNTIVLETGKTYILSGGYSASICIRDITASKTDDGNGVTIEGDGQAHNIELRVLSGTTITGTVVVKPMIRLATETDATFAPYENKCPISGWESANVTGAGKNLFSYDNLYSGYWLTNGFTGSGEPISYSPGFGWCFVRIPVEAGDTITISGCQQLGGTKSAFYHDTPNNVISDFLNTSQNGTKIVPEGANYLGLCILRNWEYDPKTEYSNAQVEIASSESTFEPYNASEIEYEFPQEAGTVYGGTLTIHQDGSGELVGKRANETIDGSQSLSLNGIMPYGGAQVIFTPSVEKKPASTQQTQNEGLLSDKFSAIDNDPVTPFGFTGRSTNGRLYINMPSDITTAADARTWFGNNNTQVSFLLATPVTYQLTNQQVLELLKGTNNLWSNTGNTAIEYAADTKLYIDEKIAELQALILES